jgi:hypothetical protein
MLATIKRRIVLTACLAIAGISFLSADGWESLAGYLNPVSVAYAYKVEKICEDTVTKNGSRQTCKTVLVKEGVGTKNDAAKDKKDSAKSDAKPPPKH